MNEDFYEVGKEYVGLQGGPLFRPIQITKHPEDGLKVAVGWRCHGGEWDLYCYWEDDWDISKVSQGYGLTVVQDVVSE